MKKVLLSFIICFLISLNIFSQTKKVKFVNPQVKSVNVEYYVLKSDEKIKEGTYKKISKGTVITSGEYHNNERVGIWKVYDYKGEVDVEINYTNGTITYPKYDKDLKKVGLINDKIIPNDNRPVINLIGGKELGLNYMHLLRYPGDAREANIMGKVVIAITVDEKGEIKGYKVNKSVFKSIDEEALRVIKLIDFEFLAAYKSGKPVEAEILLPIFFQLAQ